jgi:hypothetical protein
MILFFFQHSIKRKFLDMTITIKYNDNILHDILLQFNTDF